MTEVLHGLTRPLHLQTAVGMTPIYTEMLKGSNEAATVAALDTYAMPGGTLSEVCDSIEFEFHGTFGGDTDSEVNLVFGTETLLASGAIDTATASAWLLRGSVMRYTNASQRSWTELVYKADGGTTTVVLKTADLTQDLLSDVVIQVSGGGTTEGNVAMVMSKVTFRAA